MNEHLLLDLLFTVNETVKLQKQLCHTIARTGKRPCETSFLDLFTVLVVVVL